ncbi:hypothetical protein EAVNVH72_01880 [Elizabethkingia anophelis]|nr:hypothetical protein EAVNVH72_02828 [Elizabethkingia anophelis]CAI9682027.1 hypothetical protein EAVNVH72_01880 [Elizabethkingia anophelis]
MCNFLRYTQLIFHLKLFFCINVRTFVHESVYKKEPDALAKGSILDN